MVAVEPSGPNYELLRRNVAQLPNVLPLHLALWSTMQTLCLRHGQRSMEVLPEYAYQVSSCREVSRSAATCLQALASDDADVKIDQCF